MALALAAIPWYASAGNNSAPRTATGSKTLSATPATAQDSPLVRAAKASGRLGKKPKFVITNDTLLKFGGGHIMTTNASAPLPPIPPSAITKNKKPAGRKVETSVKKSEELKKERAVRHAAADLYGESIEQKNDDGAAQEHAMEQATSTQPVKPPV